MRFSKSIQRSLAMPAVVILLTIRPIFADMVALPGGKIVVGRVLSESPTEVRITTGYGTAAHELTLSRNRIIAVHRGVEEAAQIDGCPDAATLQKWTTEYFSAGQEGWAARCLQRALALDPAIAAAPQRAPEAAGVNGAETDPLRLFWNRVVLREQVARLKKRDANELFGIAQWAHDGGLKDDAAYYLRQAWNKDRARADIEAMATEWGVRLESWLQIDLTPVFEMPLITDRFLDEGMAVQADSDKLFITLPIRYDPDGPIAPSPRAGGARPISKSSMRSKDFKGFYGLRHLAISEGRPKLDSVEAQPVYERMEFKSGETSRLLETLKNLLGPRLRGEDNKPKQARLRKPAVMTLRATGWAAVIVEVPKPDPQLNFEWEDGGEESIDLEFLRKVHDVSLSSVKPTALEEKDDAPAVTIPVSLRKFLSETTSSAAMSALAIEALGRFRQQLPAEGDEATTWSRAVDPMIISAGARTEERVRFAAWRYFAGNQPGAMPRGISAPTLDRLAEADASVKVQWARLIECGVGLNECSFWWTRPGTDPSAPKEPAANVALPTDLLPVIAPLMSAILRSDDPYVCSAAMDVAIRLAACETDDHWIARASQEAQRQILTRVPALQDRGTAARLLKALARNAHPATAPQIAASAERLRLRWSGPADAILGLWESMWEPEEQEAWLTALRGFNLGDIVYSPRFSKIMREAVEAELAVRRAAWKLAINQEKFASAGAWNETTRKGTSPFGIFPLLVSRSARDPVVDSVVDGARHGPPEIRLEALKTLLSSGYAEEAARILLEHADKPEQIHDDLKALMSAPELGDSNAMLGLLGHLLRPDLAVNYKDILEHLWRVLGNGPNENRWRCLAALKAGVRFGELNGLVDSLDPALVPRVLRLIHILGHFSKDDRESMPASLGRQERLDQLQQISLRVGKQVDGQYAALAVVEYMPPSGPRPGQDDDFSDPFGWHAPQRITIGLPPLTLKSIDNGEKYSVTRQGQTLGEGHALDHVELLLGPARSSPALVTTDAWAEYFAYWLSSDRQRKPTGSAPSAGLAQPIAPLVLPGRRMLAAPTPGTMTLDIGEYLRTWLKAQHTFGDEDVDAIVPATYKLTLRYAAFGSFCGCGPERDPPTSLPPGKEKQLPPRYLTNVMVVLERMD